MKRDCRDERGIVVLNDRVGRPLEVNAEDGAEAEAEDERARAKKSANETPISALPRDILGLVDDRIGDQVNGDPLTRIRS